MAKPKHVINASQLIDEAFDKMPENIRPIVVKLRSLVHKAEPNIIEDWKWGPNFYLQGMVCNIWGFKKHASITFFNGVNMKDSHLLFNFGEHNSHNRTIKFTNENEINESAILAYIKEAIELNKKSETKGIKTIAIPNDFNELLIKLKLLDTFNKQSFTFRKEIIISLTTAKQETTKQRRFTKAIEQLQALSLIK